MTDLAALLARVEGASGPDREIDAQIEAYLSNYPADTTFEFGHGSTFYARRGESKAIDEARGYYTASLNAAVRLAEQVLPGWGWRIEVPSLHASRPAFCVVWAPSKHAKVSPTEGATPALALVAAIIRAKMGGAG